MRLRARHCAVAWSFVFALPLVAAETRGVALVIGNRAYPRRPLHTSENDATDIAAILKRFGYDVDLKLNLPLSGFAPAVQNLAQRATALGGSATKAPIVFYYAGHGIQVNGVNYLVPVDADLTRAGDIPLRTFSFDEVLKSVRAFDARPKIFILDACRAAPFAVSATSDWIPGLAPPGNAPPNSLVAYATDPGRIAADGIGRHSPYTRGLLRAISPRGALVEDVFRSVRQDVEANTDKEQVPWENTSLSEQFYFSSPLFATAQITDGDDDVILLVNGQQVADWNLDGATEKSIRLSSGSNRVLIKVYNQRSYTGGVQGLGGHLPEGWRYAVQVRAPQGDVRLSLQSGEDRPQDNGPRHGKLFTAAAFDLVVDDEQGNVKVANADLDAWSHPPRSDLSCAASNHAFARGYCAVRQCPNGQWVRGSVGLQSDGAVRVNLGLETDRIDRGICGQIQFALRDVAGNALATGTDPGGCIPAKPPGPVRIDDLPAVQGAIPAELAARVSTIEVTPVCGTDKIAPFGLSAPHDSPGGLEIVMPRIQGGAGH